MTCSFLEKLMISSPVAVLEKLMMEQPCPCLDYTSGFRDNQNYVLAADGEIVFLSESWIAVGGDAG
jgi:hypothetical protein